MDRLVVGSKNQKKKKEILQILGAQWQVTLLDLSDFPPFPDVVEDGTTFEANAQKKAIETALHLKEWALGEDSGLCVDALNGEPGIYSARFAGVHGNDEANNHKLLELLKGVPTERRGAGYVCVAAVANPKGEVVALARGECRGRIVDARQGEGGFGYDPYFCLQEFHQTFGQLAPAVKNAISHRARALEKLARMGVFQRETILQSTVLGTLM